MTKKLLWRRWSEHRETLEGVFGWEQLLLFLQDFIVTGATRYIGLHGNLNGDAIGVDGEGLLLAFLAELLN